MSKSLLLWLGIVLVLSAPVYSDNSYNSYESDYFTLKANSDNRLAEIEQYVDLARFRLDSLLGETLFYKPEIYLFDDMAAFNKMVEGRFPDWGAAAAIPERKMIILKSPDRFNLNKSLKELVIHEYAHLIVFQKSIFFEPPRWVNEGVAMYSSREWGWSDNIAMNKSALFGQFIPLKEIDQVNRFNESKAQIAYAESFLAVKYLIDNYTKNSMKRYFEGYVISGNRDSALMKAAGANAKEFEAEINEHLNKQFNLAGLLMDTIFFWIFLALVLVVGAFLKFKKRRSYYKKWEDEEKLHSTDFEYGDMNNPEQIDEDDDEAWRS